MNEKYCPICLGTDEADGREWTTWSCGHSIHTACALESAMRGNVTCSMCRTLLVEDEDEVAAERESAQRRATLARRQNVFLKAIRMAEHNRPVSLARVVRAYYKAKCDLETARKHKAGAVARLRCYRDDARVRGMQVRVAPKFDRRVWRAEGYLHRAKRRIQDEMLLLDET